MNGEDRFKRQKSIPGWDQETLAKSRILVVGAGTLGNEVCKNLALLGIGKSESGGNITIIDNDVIETVNLSRSVLIRNEDVGQKKASVVAKRMEELYNEINVTPLCLDIVEQYGNCNYKNFNLVIMAVDNLEARLYINQSCYIWGIPLIDGGLNGLLCNIQVIIPPNTACYECTLGMSDYRRLKNKYSCGKLQTTNSDRKIPMVITSSAIAGGLITQEAVKILQGWTPILAGKKAVIDGTLNEFVILSIKRRADCLAHLDLDQESVVILDYSNQTVLGVLLDSLKKIFGSDVRLMHDKNVVYSGTCPSCGFWRDLLHLNCNLTSVDALCEKCGDELELEIDGFLKRDDATLESHGVPNNHMLKVSLSKGEYKYLLPTQK